MFGRRSESLVEPRFVVDDGDLRVSKSDMVSSRNSKRAESEIGLGLATPKNGLLPLTKKTRLVSKSSSCKPQNHQTQSGGIPQARKEMIRLLETKLRSCNNQTINAETLERLLFASSSSMEDYSDVSTLKTRMHALLVRVVHRRLRKQQAKEAISRTLLRDNIGDERFLRAQRLVGQIQMAKLNHAKVGCGCSDTADTCPRLPPCRKLPAAVHNLFFRTQILHAFDHVTANGQPQMDWEALIAQGEAHLEAYEQWKNRSSAATC